MAPLQDECWENNVVPLSVNIVLIKPKEQAETVESIDARYDNYGGGSGNFSCPAQGEERFTPCTKNTVVDEEPRSKKLKGILRRPSNSDTTFDKNDTNENGSPAHWPLANMMSPPPKFVHFPSDSSLITATYTRPRTHILDIHALHYSSQDIRGFKRDYRESVRVRDRASRRRLSNSRRQDNISRSNVVSSISTEVQGEYNGVDAQQKQQLVQPHQPHDNSFWRSKVGRRWYGSPMVFASNTTTISSPSCENDKENTVGDAIVWAQAEEQQFVGDSSAYNSGDPLNDGSGDACSYFIDDDSDESDDDDDDEIIKSSSASSLSTTASATTAPASRSSPGLFSSVFDSAREAVSILNGNSHLINHLNSSTSCGGDDAIAHKTTSLYAKKPCNTSQHLVDTLYLF